MSEKTFMTRIMHKHDIEANWLVATNFVPFEGELIVYDPDNTYTYSRFKIGDGITNVNNLPFMFKKNIYVGTTEPTDPDVQIWINPEEDSDWIDFASYNAEIAAVLSEI